MLCADRITPFTVRPVLPSCHDCLKQSWESLLGVNRCVIDPCHQRPSLMISQRSSEMPLPRGVVHGRPAGEPCTFPAHKRLAHNNCTTYRHCGPHGPCPCRWPHATRPDLRPWPAEGRVPRTTRLRFISLARSGCIENRLLRLLACRKVFSMGPWPSRCGSNSPWPHCRNSHPSCSCWR